MMKPVTKKLARVTVTVFCSFCWIISSSAIAQTPFYQGKTITLLVGSGPGGMGDLRAKALASGLTRNIPGNPSIVFQYMPGAGGRKATNHIYSTAKPDGLTLLRVSSSIIPYAVLGESGVQYDIDKFIYLGATEHQLFYMFITRKGAGLNNLEKLRSTPGVRIGSSPVGHTGYLHSRAVAFLLDMKDPKIVPGYESADLDVAFASNEVDARVASTGTVTQNELLTKNLADFHLAIEVPRGYKDPRFAHLRLPDITSFAKSEKERKLLLMMEGFRVVGTILMAPPATPKDRVDILKEAVARPTATRYSLPNIKNSPAAMTRPRSTPTIRPRSSATSRVTRRSSSCSKNLPAPRPCRRADAPPFKTFKPFKPF